VVFGVRIGGLGKRNYGCWLLACLLAAQPSLERETVTVASLSSENMEEHTQKSIYKLPLPPNSRSPTWNVMVILSSLCSVSWKHSRECAFIWILCAPAKLLRRRHSVDERKARVEERILAALILGMCLARWSYKFINGSCLRRKGANGANRTATADTWFDESQSNHYSRKA